MYNLHEFIDALVRALRHAESLLILFQIRIRYHI